MASDAKFVAYAVEQMSAAGVVSSRKMFGEFAIYCDGRVVALVCDNQLFVKPTKAGRALLRTPTEAPPYPGASLYFLIDDGIDDREALVELIAATARELPPAKPKLAAKAKTKKRVTKR